MQIPIETHSRRGAIAFGLLSFLFAPSAAEAVGSNPLSPQRNNAVLEALKAREQKKDIEDGEVIFRLTEAREQISRATMLANAGEYSSARNLLRGDSVGSIRDDLKKMESYLAFNRPTFERFEEMALIGALEAFDNALRSLQREDVSGRQQQGVTVEDLKIDGRLLMKAIDDVIGVLTPSPYYLQPGDN